MKTIRFRRCGWVALALLLGACASGRAQKRLPIGGSTVPPVGGQTTPSNGTVPNASMGGNGLSGLPAEEPDSSVRRNMEALRVNMRNDERQRMMVHESAQLVQMTTALQTKMAANAADAPQAEMLRQLDAIEKMARDVKDRMKGVR